MSSTPRWIKISAEVAGAAAAIAAVAVAVGAFVWNRKTRRNVRRLTTRSLGADRNKYKHSCDERKPLAVLAAPVARYLEFAITDGQPLIRTATLRQTGVLRVASNSALIPFSGVEYLSVQPPGFIWDASLPNGFVCPFAYSRQLHQR